MCYRKALVACSLGVCALIVACSTGGGTGGVPDDGRMLDRVASEKFEYGSTAVGRDRDINLHRGDGLGLVYAPALSVYLNSVLSRLVAVAPVEAMPVRVFLQATPQWGASSSADANIYLNLGLLMGLENEDELAAVLAHELSHVVLQHHTSDQFENTGENVKTMTRVAQGVEMGLLMAGVMDAPVVSGNELLEHQADLVELSTLVISPTWNRRQETEADILGTDLLIGAGYNKVAMLTVLDKQRAFEESLAADQAAAPAPTKESRKAEKRRMINLGGVQVDMNLAKMVGPLGRKHRKAEDRREIVQAYINREYRRAPRPRIKGAQWSVIVEGGTTKALLANYARAFDAEQRLVSGDVDGAVRDLAEAVGEPTSSHAYPRFLFAQTWLQQGDSERALRNLESAFDNLEPSVKIFQSASAVHLDAGRTAEAVAVLERAYKLFEGTPGLTPDLIRAYRASGRDDAARQVARRCERDYPRLKDLCDPDAGDSGFRVRVSARD
jgi:predicted Zn-dependent protease